MEGATEPSTSITEIRRRLIEGDPLEIAEDLTRREPEDRAIRFRLLAKDQALEVFEALDTPQQMELLEGLRAPRVRELVEDLDPDDRARLIDEMPAKVADRLLRDLSPNERRMTTSLLGYPRESAGRIMSPEVVALRPWMSAQQAMEHVRRRGTRAETVYALPVTDETRRFVGLVDLRSLVLADPEERVDALMEEHPRTVSAYDDQEAVARLMQEADMVATPVLDAEDRLVGVVTVDDALEVIEAEESEDAARIGGAEPLGGPYLSVRIRQLVTRRIVWLFLLIAAAGLTVSVLNAFEGTLESVVSLALFIPLIIGTGGNTGSQAATTMTRALAVGDVRPGDVLTIAAREVRVGFLIGVILGAIAYPVVSAFFDADIALTVSLSLVAICSYATLMGSVLPLGAQKARIDPAVVSAPLIATLVDATGLIMYFMIARTIVGV